jgi:hypothetical protein
MSQFKTKLVRVPDCDCDITLVFPSKEEITIQCRPSNADENYKGSLDILLPNNTNVICWEGDDMTPARATHPDLPEGRYAKQLCIELP